MVEITTQARINLSPNTSIVVTGTGYIKFITGFKGMNGSSPFINDATETFGPVDSTGGTVEINPANNIDYEIVHAASMGGAAPVRTVAKYDVILVIGQSNTHYGGGEDGNNVLDRFLDYTPDTVKQYGRGGLNDRQVIPAFEPLQHNSMDPGRNGFCMEFARQYVARGLLAADRHVLLLPCALGGSGFQDGSWNPGNAIYEDAVSRTNQVLDDYPDSRLVAVLWHQGEDDLTALTDDAYTNAFFTMLDDLRSRTVMAPFICGGLVPFWLRGEHGERRNAVITGWATQRPYMGFASPGFPTIIAKADDTVDSIHFSNIGQRELGRRYFNAWLEARHRVAVPARGIWSAGDMYMHMDFNQGVTDRAGNIRNAQLIAPSNIVVDPTRQNVLSMPDATRTAGGVDLGDAYTLGSRGYTKAAWINLIDLNAFNNILSTRDPNITATSAIFWIRGDGDPRLSGSTGGDVGGHGEYPVDVAFVGNWNHVATTYNKDTGRALTYVNGTVVLSAVEDINLNLSDTEVIGGFGLTNSRFYGLIDDVRVWHRPLGVEEMANLYLQTLV